MTKFEKSRSARSAFGPRNPAFPESEGRPGRPGLFKLRHYRRILPGRGLLLAAIAAALVSAAFASQTAQKNLKVDVNSEKVSVDHHRWRRQPQPLQFRGRPRLRARARRAD